MLYNRTITEELPEDLNKILEAPTEPPTPYEVVPCSEGAIKADIKLIAVQQWLEGLKRPDSLTYSEYKSFM